VSSFSDFQSLPVTDFVHRKSSIAMVAMDLMTVNLKQLHALPHIMDVLISLYVEDAEEKSEPSSS
jgi:hypothetical protein